MNTSKIPFGSGRSGLAATCRSLPSRRKIQRLTFSRDGDFLYVVKLDPKDKDWVFSTRYPRSVAQQKG